MELPSVRIPGYEKHARMLNFIIRLNIFAIPLYVILLLNLNVLEIQQALAGIVYALLNAAGMGPSINGLLISIPIKNGSWGAFINWDCTAWKSMLAFFALVMATDFKNKLKGLALFIPLIFLVNILRIFFMFWFVRTFDVANFALVHAIVWSWGMIFVVLAFWLIWMKWLALPNKKRAQKSGFNLPKRTEKQIYSKSAK